MSEFKTPFDLSPEDQARLDGMARVGRIDAIYRRLRKNGDMHEAAVEIDNLQQQLLALQNK